MKRRIFFWILLSILGLNLYSLKLENIKTDDMNLMYYSNAHSYIVPHLAKCYLRSWKYYQNLFNHKPNQPTNIFIEDFSDWSNGGATAVSNNFVYISMSPYFYTFEVSPGAERMSLLMHHELAHVVAMDMYSGRDLFFRNLFFSKIQHNSANPITMLYGYLTSPRKYAPRWYHEGIAVNLETWLGGGIGRAMGAYDEMVFRGLVKDNVKIYDMVGLEAEGTAIDFQVGANSYLYGTRFFSYLTYMYGKDKLFSWVKRDSKTKAYFADQFKHVYKTDLRTEWQKWIDFEKQHQNSNLVKIRQNPVTNFKPLTKTALGSVSKSFYNSKNNKIYVGVKSVGQLPHIASFDATTGEKEKICDIKGASTYYTTNMVLLEDENKIVYTTDNFYRRDLNIVDLASKKTKLLMKDARTGELAYDKTTKEIWGVRHENGISTLVKFVPPYTDWQAMHAFDYGTDAYDLDFSPDGTKLTASITFVSGKQKLVYFDLNEIKKGNYNYTEIFDFDYNSPANFVFSNDGNTLYGTSYYSGVSNVYKYDFVKKDIFIISNAETGFFRPLKIADSKILVYNYVGGKGWLPGFIEDKEAKNVSAIDFLGQKVYDKHPDIKTITDGDPNKIDLKSKITYQGEYSFIKNFKTNGIYPIVQGYKNYAAYGFEFTFSDDLFLNNLKFSLTYTPKNEKLEEDEQFHFNADYKYQNFKFRASYNKADFYDLFGPTKVSRKGTGLGFGYTYSLIYDKPQTMDLNFDIDGYTKLEELPDYQNVDSGYDKMLSASLGVDYSFVQNSLGKVDDESGYKASLYVKNIYAKDKNYPKVTANFDLGTLLPINHTSIWLRNYAGAAYGDIEDSFTNFYFGGFGNNYIDKKSEKQYHNATSFAGSSISSIEAKNYGKSMLELNLPPLRFSTVGTTRAYLRWIRASVFSSVLYTNINNEDLKTYYYNVGAQLDIRLVSYSFFKTTISVGVARAFDEDNNYNDELMLSVKLF